MSRSPLRTRRDIAGTSPANVLALLVAVMWPALPAHAAPPAGSIVFASDRGGHSDLWAMRADGTMPLNLTNDEAEDDLPAWSPDGLQIAWTKGGFGPGGEIWVMDADGGHAHQVTTNVFSDLDATWSPDGKWIAFSSSRDGNRDIYVIDADGRNERRLTTDRANDYAPDWSPDGKRIAWTSDRSGHQAVYTMNVYGRDDHRVTPVELEGGLPGWSPDARQILFSDALCATCGESDLWVVNADGKGLRQITDTPTNERAKSWSLDGKAVVGDLSNLTTSDKRVAKGDIAVWDVATGAVTRLTRGDGDGHPDWSAGPWPVVFAWHRTLGALGASAEPKLLPGDTAAWSRAGGGVASIEYSLPKAGHVCVRVYDEDGREVARPVDEWQPAGRHKTSFAFGPAPNQVFHYRVECSGRTSASGSISTGP